MDEETKKVLTEWAGKLGLPVENLVKDFEEQIVMFKKNVPGKTEKWYEEASRHRIYLEIKADIVSPAKPYDITFFGIGAKIDAAAGDITARQSLWNNPSTREQAVFENKVYRYTEGPTPRMTTKNKEGKDIPVPDGTPLDTREWMIAPNAEKNEKGRRNRNYGKPLLPSIIRTLVGVGRPANGGKLKLVNIMMAGEERAAMLPPMSSAEEVKPVRTRINVREDRDVMVVANGSTKTKFEPITMDEIPDGKALLAIVNSAPAALKVGLVELPEWHKLHEDDNRRTVIIEGDVSRINREPTAYGSLMLVIEDTSKEDLEAEGTTIWVPQELEHIVDRIGEYSHVTAIGRTTEGPGYNRETHQLDQSIVRIMVNAVGLLVDPELRVPPEEETVVEAQPVK